MHFLVIGRFGFFAAVASIATSLASGAADVVTATLVGFRKQHPRHDGRGRLGDEREFLQPPRQCGGIDGDLRRACGVAHSAGRLTSL